MKKIFLLGAVLLSLNVYGSEGSWWPQGKEGPQGIAGPTGPVGPPGSVGLRGPAGSQGIPGDCSTIPRATASLYSLIDQRLSGGDPVLFEEASAVAPLTYDASLAPSTGEVVFLKSGVYNITWGAEGRLHPPFSNPAPAWALALYLDGAPILGSCFPGFSLSPSGHTTFAGGRIAITVTEGQVLTLQSASSLPISLVARALGSFVPLTSASLVIESE
jgi:hypothetical protein